MAQCDEQKEAIAEKESLLNKINDAYIVKPYYNNYVNAENTKKDLDRFNTAAIINQWVELLRNM